MSVRLCKDCRYFSPSVRGMGVVGCCEEDYMDTCNHAECRIIVPVRGPYSRKAAEARMGGLVGRLWEPSE